MNKQQGPPFGKAARQAEQGADGSRDVRDGGKKRDIY